MRTNIFISLLFISLLGSSMSETIVLVLKGNKKEVNIDLESEKNEERNEKEIEELTKLNHQNYITFSGLIVNICQKPIEFINMDYTNPSHSISTPPPKAV